MTIRFSLFAFLLAFVLAAPAALAQNADIAAPSNGATPMALAPFSAPSALAGSVLYDNGPLVNSPATGASGADESVLQGNLGLGFYGFGHQILNDNRMAEDFTVPAGGWDIDEMVFYAYQTGSSTTSTMTDVYVQIWDGAPNDPASSVVWGDLTTNRLTSSNWTGAYRVTDTSSGNADRPIMANTVAVDVTLAAGTYWVVWQTGGTLGSGPWAPPVTITGQTTTGNALQYTSDSGSWAPALDNTFAQGLPFLVMGPAGPNVSIAVNTSDVNPERGEAVFFRGPVTNNGGTDQPVYVYFTYDIPGVGTFKRNLGGRTLDPGESFNYRDFQNSKNFVPVTEDAPAGTYTVTVYAASDRFGTEIYDTDSFTFTLDPIAPPPAQAAQVPGASSLEVGGLGAAPNPFRDQTEIRYALAESGDVDLRVFDAAGREVAALVSGTQSAGAHAATFAAADLPAGVYVWRLLAGGDVTTGRVTLAR